MLKTQDKYSIKLKDKENHSILMELIRGNQIERLKNILKINDTFFYPESKSQEDNPFAFFLDNVTELKERSCYIEEAVKEKNAEILELLFSYGFSFQILSEAETGDYEDEKNRYMFMVRNYLCIDPTKPFITEDVEMFELLLKRIPDINKIYPICWLEQEGYWEYREMTLLSIALYFKKMSVAECLLHNGANLQFNLYSYLIGENSKPFGTIGALSGMSMINGHISAGSLEYKETLAREHEQSPIGIIFKSGDFQQIDWLLNHYEGMKSAENQNPYQNHRLTQLFREIVKSVYYLKKNDLIIFLKKYPEYLEHLRLKDLCHYSHSAALRLFLQEIRPRISRKDLIDILDFYYQSNRPHNEVFNYVLSVDYLRCIRAIYSYAPDLFKAREVQHQLYNTALYIETLNDEWERLSEDSKPSHKTDLKRIAEVEGLRELRDELSLLRLYDEIADGVPDATLLIRWYYGRRKDLDFYRIKIQDAVKALKKCRRPKLKDKPVLNQDVVFYEDREVSALELAAILDTFQLKSEVGTLGKLYQMVVKKDHVPLLRKLLNTSNLNTDEIRLLTEYAINTGSEKLIPILLLYKMKNNLEYK